MRVKNSEIRQQHADSEADKLWHYAIFGVYEGKEGNGQRKSIVFVLQRRKRLQTKGVLI
jgi:hypothetical protein